MIEVLKIYFIPTIVTVLSSLYLGSKILKKKINFKSWKFYVGFLISFCLIIMNHSNSSGFIRFFNSTFIVTIMNFLVFEKRFNISFYAAVIEQMILFISEFLCALLFLVFKINIFTLTISEGLNLLIINSIILLIAMILCNLKPIKYIYNKIISYLEQIDGFKKYFLALFLIFTLNILMFIIYFNEENILVIIVNTSFMVIYSGIMYSFANEKSENIKFKMQNQMLLDNLNEYEKMLDYQRISNHENKNQLLVIKGLISKSNKKAIQYVDEVINDAKEDSETLFAKAKRIPTGGLQGLIYQKMLYMQSKNINVELDVSKSLKKLNISNISAKTNYDICRMAGIILDNAIEEVLKMEKKDIAVSLYKDEDLFIIEVSNHFKELPDLTKINNKGFTTKGKGHGYGLSLLKKIEEENQYITNETKITKDIFTQVIKIKM